MLLRVLVLLFGRSGRSIAATLITAASLAIGISGVVIAREANYIAREQERRIDKEEAARPAGGILRVSDFQVASDETPRVDHRCVLFSGYSINVSPLDTLWLITRPTSSGKYWGNPIRTSNEPTPDQSKAAETARDQATAWRGSVTLGTDQERENKTFSISLVRVTSKQSAALESARAPHLHDGMDALPDDNYEILHTVKVERIRSDTSFSNPCSIGDAR